MNKKILICWLMTLCCLVTLYSQAAEKAPATKISKIKTKKQTVAKPAQKFDEKKLAEFKRASKAAAAGKPWGMFNVGKCYFMGYGVNKDLPKAVEWYTKAAKKDHVIAMITLGDCYRLGQ